MELQDLAKSVQLAWHGVNDPINLRHFLNSSIEWGEGDLRQDGQGRLVLRHDSFETHPLSPGESLLLFQDWLESIHSRGKKIKVDMKEGGETVRKMESVLKGNGFKESDLWLTTNFKDMSIEEFGKLRDVFPKVIFQSTVPLRFMFQVMTPEERNDFWEMNQKLGVSRMSICWYDEPTLQELSEMTERGFEINLYHVNNIQDFKSALLLKPAAITSDFHIPEWNLFGRGSGENGFYLEK